MSLIILFGLIGLSVGGFRGLLVGVALGYVASWVLRTVVGGRLALVQAQFLDSTFAVMGALCKVDGVVTRDEIAIAETMFARLHLSGAQRETARTAFNRGKAQVATRFDTAYFRWSQGYAVRKVATACSKAHGLVQHAVPNVAIESSEPILTISRVSSK